LFAATPNQAISTYIVIPDKREEEAKAKIGSLANRKDGLNTRIKYITFSSIFNDKVDNLDDIAKVVI
jgi:hypothetical protein